MENRTVRFAVNDNNNFYKIELSKTLLHFTEYDFTYFWEQCIEAGRIARKTGRLPQNIISNAKTVISRAHPYIEACISSDYAEIVTDCIIEYICHSERIGLEELWARCISPKNLYETAIFRRISEYKTNRATNRWTSIVRLQEYARNKIEFIFGTAEGEAPLTEEIIRTRKEYFDLAVSVAANELGCPASALPSVKLCTPSTLPNAAFAVSKVAKAIYRRFSDALSHGQDMSALESKNCTKISDQVAMEAYAYVKNMSRPGEIDMKFALEAIRENPSEVYLPDSLKAAIDLEFELMARDMVYLRKCEGCGRFFTVTDDSTRCDRVNSSGKTCRRQYEELVESIAMETRSTISAEEAAAEEIKAAELAVAKMLESKQEITVPPEMEKRCQKLYNALYKRVGKGIDENEFKEWSQYLSNMKRNLKIGEATLSQLDEFLDYSDKLCDEVKLASKNKTTHAPVEKTYVHAPAAPASESIPSASAAETQPEPQVPQVEASVVSSDSVRIKPFEPQTFDTLFDAFMAGNEEGEEVAPEKREKKHVEIKMPQWERLTREDAYGKKD